MQKSIYELGNNMKFRKEGGRVRGFLRTGRTVSVFECDTSVAYSYFKVLLERERRKRTALAYKKEAAPVAPPRASKEEVPVQEKTNEDDSEAHHHKHHHHPRIHVPDMKKMRGNCKEYCAVISYVVLGVLAIMISVGVIIMTSLASVATKIYDAEQSSRLVAMVVLAVTAAVTLSIIIYAIVGAFKKKAKPLHAAGIVLIILAVIQALIVGVAVKVTALDELAIGKSLGESFRLAKADNPRHVKLWSATQSDLQCCGMYSPEDYRDHSMPFYFPPNVPISCCPTYDVTKPPYSQERQREMCKVNGTYFENGCKGLVIEVFKETSVVVIGIIVVLIVLEVSLTILGAYLNKKHSSKKHEHDHSHDEHDHQKSQPAHI